MPTNKGFPDIERFSWLIGQRFSYRETLIFIMGRDPVEHAKRAKYKPPAMRVRDDCYTKKSPFRYNKVVQANL